MIRVVIFWSIIFAIIVGIPAAYGGCHHLYRAHAVHHAVVQPVVLYSVGDSLRIEAAVEQALRKREALQDAPQPVKQTIFAAKCAKCHNGDKALTSDPATFKAFARMAGLGEEIPTEMKGVIGSLTPAEKGELTEYLLRLPTQSEGVLK